MPNHNGRPDVTFKPESNMPALSDMESQFGVPEDFYGDFSNQPVQHITQNIRNFHDHAGSGADSKRFGFNRISKFRWGVRGAMALGGTVLALAAVNSIDQVIDGIEGIHLPDIGNIFKHETSVSGSSWADAPTYPETGIIGEVEGGAYLEADTTGGLLNHNFFLVGNPTESTLHVRRKGDIALTLNNIGYNLSVVPAPHPSKPASPNNEPTVYVNSNGLEIQPTGIECSTNSTDQCEAGSTESELEKVKPLVPLALALTPLGEASILTKVLGFSLVDSVTNDVFGNQGNVASRTESLAKDADYAYADSCGKEELATRTAVTYGVQRFLKIVDTLNAERHGTSPQEARTLENSSDSDPKVIIVDKAGDVVKGNQIPVNYVDPEPTASTVEQQFGVKNVTLHDEQLFNCIDKDPSAQITQSEQIAFLNSGTDGKAPGVPNN
jgi:hypothetical protein